MLSLLVFFLGETKSTPTRMSLSIFFIALLLLCVARSEILIESVPILDQLNASLDTSNKLVSQRFTDILPQIPLLHGADDFVLPANISNNITIMRLSFTIVRQFRDSDPDSITVSLMYNDPVTNGPGVVFFTKSVRAPNNPPRWYNDSLEVPEIITFNITQNEVSSTNQSVYFNFADTVFLPRQTKLWLTMYVTGTRSYDISPPYAENVLFWCIAANATQSILNAPYFFVDESDIIGKGLTNWTNASRVETLLGFTSRSKNMAWSLTLVGVAPSTFLEMLQSIDTKKLVVVIVCSIVGLLFICLCVMCICKRCRRCRRRTLSNTVAFSELNSTINTVPSSSSYLDENALSEISLDGSKASHTLRSTTSGRYLESATHIPVKTRTTATKKGGNGSNSSSGGGGGSEEYDKEK